MRTPRLCIALDGSWSGSIALAESLRGEPVVMKVGLGAFTAQGPSAVGALKSLGFDVFLDLKLHDIPNTVGAAAKHLGELGVNYATLHASGGRDMMRAAKQSAPEVCWLGVTVLTSLDDAALRAIGFADSSADVAARLAQGVLDEGLGGVVCSPLEARAMRTLLGESSAICTPGIRNADDESGDQKRTATVAEAVKEGSSLLVVGRPITQASSPKEATLRMLRAIDAAWSVASSQQAISPR